MGSQADRSAAWSLSFDVMMRSRGQRMLTGGPTTRQDEFWPRNSTLPIPMIPQRPRQGSAQAQFGGVYNRAGTVPLVCLWVPT